jgi:predicted house-cleaning NTP pyrophosphatase (Maf/HAM1 superfamily)
MAEVWTDFAIVEFDEIEADEMVELIETESWIGKAGGYDLAGKAGSFSRVIEGDDVTVLGFSARGFDEIRRLFL